MVDFVCKDFNDSFWEYDPELKIYVKTYKNGEQRYITGKNLPDPDELWRKRLEIYKRKGERVNIDALKPSPAVFFLWEHNKNVQS
jgi:hypothetical protein